MTRETKIGLLVGLAFIIVIGILLSDHLTSSTEPPQAALGGAGNSVRQAVASPGNPVQQPPITAPTVSGPHQPVATQNELTSAQNPVQIVKIGGPSNASNTTPDNSQAANANNRTGATANPPAASDPQQSPAQSSQQVAQPDQVAGADAPPITKVGSNPLDAVARANGEELIDQNGRAIHAPGGSTHTKGTEYTAQPGDSLSKICAKFLGSDNKANRDAVMAANPFMKGDPSKIFAGRSYAIPAVATTAANPASESTQSVATNAPTPAQTTPSTLSTPSATSGDRETGEYYYTVKDGDSLYRIAREQLGKAGAWVSIKELNKDILIGDKHEDVVIGMKLKLPAKPIAQASTN